MTEKYSKSIYFIGPGVGTDAGGWYIGPDGKIHRVPGWNPEVAVDLAHAISVLREAGQIKQKGLAEAVIRDVLPQVQAQLGEQLKDGGVLVIGA
jgi:hypothetical protein